LLILRIKYEKNSLVKYISHLDVMRTFTRALRRAKLPLCFSQGFNPRPKIEFAPALPVGITSEGEYLDVEFEGKIEPDKALAMLNNVLPSGLCVKASDFAQDKPSLSSLNMALYLTDIYPGKDIKRDVFADVLARFLTKKQIIVEKHTKGKIREIDIAPLIYDIEMAGFKDGIVQLALELCIGQEGNVKPQMVISSLEKMLNREVKISSIHRKDMFVYKEGIKVSPL
jgi:radical SAM-linked protein